MFMFFHIPTQACCEKKFEESFYRARMPVLLAKETGQHVIRYIIYKDKK
jgi:hypothetical protein